MLIKRLFARYIDNIIIFTLSLILGIAGFLIGSLFNSKDLAAYLAIAAFTVSFIVLYTIDYVILTKRSGSSIGKKLLGIKLVNDNKSDLTYTKVFFRELLLQIVTSIGGIGLILLLIPYMSSSKKLLHDNAFSTDVAKIED